MKNWKKTLAEETLAFIEGGELAREAYRAGEIAEAEELARIRARGKPDGGQYPMAARLVPRTPWQGGRMAATDVLELSEAASMATAHAGQTVTIKDFLRAASRAEIPLQAIIHQSAKTEPCRLGDAAFNDGEPVPKSSIPTLPLSACTALANTGRAEWRTFDFLEQIDGVMMRFTRWKLAAGEPDFETTPDDCRVMGFDVHTLADAFKSTQETQDAPVVAVPAKTGTEKRWTAEFTAEVMAYRNNHTEAETAQKFGVSGTRIRKKLAEQKRANTPKASPFPTARRISK